MLCTTYIINALASKHLHIQIQQWKIRKRCQICLNLKITELGPLLLTLNIFCTFF